MAGFAIGLLPLLLALFPSLTTLASDDRVMILVGWGALAGLAGLVAARADDRLDRRIEAHRAAVVAAERRVVIRERFESMLGPGAGGLPVAYQLSVYVPSEDGRFMVPVFPRALGPEDPAIFAVGTGATGRLWANRDRELGMVVKGEAVWNVEHGLTPLQQRRYRDCEVAAAVVILDDEDRSIGVLSTVAVTDDGFFGEDEGGIGKLGILAHGIAWLLPDAVEWLLGDDEEF